MLWDASSIRGYSVVISGEAVGTVKDFYFDRSDWTIAWVIVETGSLLLHKYHCVPAAALTHPVTETKQITLSLTAAEFVEALPDAPATCFSLAAFDKAAVEGTDSNVGHVHDVLIDVPTWQIKYLVIDPSDWLSEDKVLIPAGTVTEIGGDPVVVKLGVTRQYVQDGPRYDPVQTVDGAYDNQFLTYYGIKFVKK